jgi:hypothetical protein
VQLAIAAAPGCAHDHLFVTIERVRFQPAGVDAVGVEVALSSPQRVDVGAQAAPIQLARASLPAGHYDSVQLVLRPNAGNDQLANAVQWRGGALVALEPPRHASVPVELDVPPQGDVQFVLAPDVCAAVRAGAQGAPVLKAQLRFNQRRDDQAALAAFLP